MKHKEKTEQSKRHLLLTGIKLFGTNGYDATSVSEIEAELNLTRGAIAYHYKSKLGFFEATVNKYLFERVMPSSVPNEFRNSLKDFILKYITMLEDECVSLMNNGVRNVAGTYLNLETDALRSIPDFRNKCAEQNRCQLAVLEQVIRNAISSREIKDNAIPIVVAEMFLNVVIGQAYRSNVDESWYYTDGMLRQFNNLYRLISNQ